MAAPSIISFSPHSQAPGQPVIIIGTSFTGTISVTFGIEDALTFFIDSDTQITAYPNINNGETITITNLDGQDTVSGFTPIIVKVKITDLPVLGRNASTEDLLYIYDNVRHLLCSATGQEISDGIGGTGGGGTGSGVTQTQLGSPFKVRNTDVNYSDDGNDVTITDLRLVGKRDYIVSSTDFNQEFENYLADALTASFIGVTEALDGTYIAQSALTSKGIGNDSKWDVTVLSGVVTVCVLNEGGQGYEVGDKFVLDNVPGITFTIESVGTDFIGNLLYNSEDGILTIKNYVLSNHRHISIYADGVVDISQNTITAKITLFERALSPIISTIALNSKSGVILPWRLPANLIPDGWQECTDFRGKIPVGQDTSDVYDATTNPNGLSQAINTVVGINKYTLLKANLPAEGVKLKSNSALINPAGIGTYVGITQQIGATDVFSENLGEGKPISMLSSSRIVEWIEFVG